MATTNRTALVLYGSETGNAQDVAEDIGRLCERLRFATNVAELDSVSLRQLLQSSIVIFAISTTGQGELPANAQKFWRSLRSARLPPTCLRTLHFTSFGLGDSSYTQFNWAHKKLSNRLLQLGARVICDRAESDEQHPEGIDGSFIPWSMHLRKSLLEQFPLPDGEEPIPDDVLLEAKWTLEQIDLNAIHVREQIASNGSADLTDDKPPDDLLSLPDGIIATVLSNKRVTPLTHWQDVRHLSFALSGTQPYGPGDIFTIYPKNFPSDVDHFIRIGGWGPVADVPLRFSPSDQSRYESDAANYPPPPIASLKDSTFTLRQLFINYLDIISIPRRSFFAHLVHYTTDEFQSERLKEFINPEFIDELFDYTTRPRRSILEVLDEFTSVTIPWQRLCSIIPAIRGRQFSIASGGSLKVLPKLELGTKVELLVAIVKYRTVIKRIRQGVCTRYIASLLPDQSITVTMQKGGLNMKEADMVRPVVMIGPGTGVAPMRSLVYERLKWRAANDHAAVDGGNEDTLVFGCRNADSDFFFKDEWMALDVKGDLKTFAAFSRDQRQKVYVQDIVRQQSSRIYKALAEKGGVVYICGSSGKMPQAVREALIEVFERQGGMDRHDAEEYLTRMGKDGRYKQETW